MTRTRTRASRGLIACALAACAMPGAAYAADHDSLRADDFAYGRSITPESARALQSVALDLDVYRHSVEAGLADLRVFDAQGEPVPHAIRHAPPAPAREPRVEPLPVFRVDDGASAQSPVDGFEIDAEISETGAILRLRGPAPSLPGPETGGTWIVDASSLGREPMIGLELDLAPSAGDFVAHLRVDASEDLTHFRTRVPHAALARFSQGGHEIERLDLGMPSTRARYLRLTLIDGVLPADLRGVSARIATPPTPPEREHTRLVGAPVAREPGSFVYDIGGDLPIERIDVLPGEPNTLLEIQIDSAAAAEGPWTTRYTGLVYRLESGGTLRSAPIPWRVDDRRLLRVRVSPKGGGSQQADPELELEWRPAQVVFVARGEGPFMLAYGKRGAPDTAFEASRIVQLAGDGVARLDDTTASLGPVQVLAGDLAYERAPTPVSWRKLALWGVLVLTVGSVLWMSVRLLGGARDDEASDPPGNDL